MCNLAMFYKRTCRFSIRSSHPIISLISLGFMSEMEGFPASALHARGILSETHFAMFYKRNGRISHPGDRIP